MGGAGGGVCCHIFFWFSFPCSADHDAININIRSRCVQIFPLNTTIAYTFFNIFQEIREPRTPSCLVLGGAGGGVCCHIFFWFSFPCSADHDAININIRSRCVQIFPLNTTIAYTFFNIFQEIREPRTPSCLVHTQQSICLYFVLSCRGLFFTQQLFQIKLYKQLSVITYF